MDRSATAATDAVYGLDVAALRRRAHRTRRRTERRIPWPGDVTADEIALPNLEGIPAWINGRRTRAHRVIGFGLAATLLLDLAYVMMAIAG